jgi:Asp-tRNA(Asn)/Glu-tRNA(Gln) amidotransferase A subunit family amidase
MFRAGAEFAPANDAITAQIALLAQRGAVVVDDLRTGLDLIAIMPTLRLNSFELRSAFDAYLRRRGDAKVKTLADLIATGRFLKGGNLELRMQETMNVEVLEFDEEYRRRRDVRLRLRRTLIELMDRERVDALAYPAKALGAPPLGSTDAAGGRDNAISSVAGLPAIVVPSVSDRDGLPVGLELLGRPFSEPSLIRIALEYERVRGPRVLPKTVQ